MAQCHVVPLLSSLAGLGGTWIPALLLQLFAMGGLPGFPPALWQGAEAVFYSSFTEIDSNCDMIKKVTVL